MPLPCRVRLNAKKTYAFTDLFPQNEETEEEDFFEEDFEEEEFLPTDDFDEAEELLPDAPPRPEFSTSLEADGILSVESDGTLSVYYEDPYISGVSESRTTFRFHTSGVVTMTSEGAKISCLAFEKGKRCLCDYGAVGGIYSVTLHTHEMENHLDLSGGEFTVDYSVEVHGSVSERSRLELFVTLGEK